jgi:hypothetical protein
MSQRIKVLFKKLKLTLIYQKMQDTNNLFHAQCILLETKQIISEAFPDVMDNKDVLRGDCVKWFSLCSQEMFMIIDL